MTQELTYEDLAFPTFINSHPAITLTAYEVKDEKVVEKTITLPFSDAIKAAEISGVGQLHIGDTRTGKSLVMMDMHRNHFGGKADDGGRSNWNVARNDFTANGYFMTADQSKIGAGKGLLNEARVPIKRRINAVVNWLDEINLMIPEVQVEAFGMAEGRQEDIQLGDVETGYYLFGASCNLNRVNGDFAGVSPINRALLNRCGVIFDHDFYKTTDEDRDILDGREVTGKLQLAPIRDITDKIITAYQEIRKSASVRDPFLDAYLRFISSGLDYCSIDKDNLKKRTWPSRCSGCTFTKKDLCSLVKQSNTGTVATLKRFANGLKYLVQLKHGQTSIDPLDLALAAYEFTTYHGNLNGVEAQSTYSGEDQEQMRDVVSKLRDKIMSIRRYLDRSIDNAIETGIAETRFIEISDVRGQKVNNIYSEADKERLDEIIKQNGKISYNVQEPFKRAESEKFAKENGIRIDWFPGYLNSVAENYAKVK